MSAANKSTVFPFEFPPAFKIFSKLVLIVYFLTSQFTPANKYNLLLLLKLKEALPKKEIDGLADFQENEKVEMPESVFLESPFNLKAL